MITTKQQNNCRKESVGKLTNRNIVQVRRKEEERITDTWVSVISSSCLSSHAHAWPVDASCHPAGVRSSAYTLASNPPPQTYPWNGEKLSRGERKWKKAEEGQRRQKRRMKSKDKGIKREVWGGREVQKQTQEDRGYTENSVQSQDWKMNRK